MRIDILTLFPEMFAGPFSESMLGRAQENGLLSIAIHDIRAWADNKHSKADDYPFGGGAGLVMMAQPIFDAVEAVDPDHEAHRVLLTPRGKLLTTARARELARCPMDEEVSIGDYILTGGELPAMVLTDCVSRFVPGVLGKGESAEEESFSKGLLEYPQYTRPADFRGMAVPEVLLSGHAANIEKWRHEQALMKTREKWRHEQALMKTRENRPELLGTFGKYYENKGK